MESWPSCRNKGGLLPKMANSMFDWIGDSYVYCLLVVRLLVTGGLLHI